MGNESRMIFSKCCVSQVLLLLLLLLVVPFLVQSQCPSNFNCSVDGLRASCTQKNLAVIPQGPFNRKLQTLDLSYNRIGILKPSVFADRQIYTLINLTLSNNIISDMQEPFRGLSSLKYLDLSNNDINTFSPEIFDDIIHLKTLILHHNPYLELADTGYDLPELTDLILNNCGFKKIPNDFFNKLKALEFVDLSENSIDHFDSNVLLSYLENVKSIDLSSNRLHILGEVVSSLPPSIKVLKISPNPWSCNCEIKEMFAVYQSGSYEMSSLICSSPEDFKNQTLTAELVKLIICTTTTEETTSTSMTAAMQPVAMVQSLMTQNDQNRASVFETISNSSSDQEKSGRISISDDQNALPPLVSETTNPDKTDDDEYIDKAGWLGNWMIYSAVALVVATSIVVFFVKYQVQKHMSKPGNDLARNSADFGWNTGGGYSAISLTENSSRVAV